MAFLVPRAHCWLRDSFLSTRTLWAFSAELLPSGLAPIRYWCMEFRDLNQQKVMGEV